MAAAYARLALFTKGASPAKKSWGPIRLVEVDQDPYWYLGTLGLSPDYLGIGISIEGGKIDRSTTVEGQPLDRSNHSLDEYPEVSGATSGVFIKDVIPDSPAGRSGQLFVGDHIVQVDNTELNCSLDQQMAFQTIKNARNPVKFKVRSLRQKQVCNKVQLFRMYIK